MRLVQPIPLACAVALLLAVSCADGDTRAAVSSSLSTTDTEASRAPTSSITPTTTSSSSTTPSNSSASSSTDANTVAFVLRPDGLGALSFGAESALVLASMTPVFGVPNRDESAQYQHNDETERWESGRDVFTYRNSRTVCWSDVLCLFFGGDAADQLRFVGWTYSDPGKVLPVALSTADGIAVGSLLSDHIHSITVLPDSACLSSVSGTTPAGLKLLLHSVGTPFISYDSTGTLIRGNPPPEDIVVSGLFAGDSVGNLSDDC